MFKTFKDLFDQFTAPWPDPTPAGQAQAVQLATAVLLVEVMRAEPTLAATERTAVLAALKAQFTLTDDALERLIEHAHDTAQTAYDYQRFTALLNERFSQDQKIAVVEAMWRVAYADTQLDAHEQHVISKVAGLLHVTHGQYIAAKLHAKAAAQPG